MIKQITPNISVIYENVTDHPLFEGEWPIPEGVTLNAYLVRGKKAALIDLTADWDSAVRQFEEQIGDAKVSFLILNHLEPDHTGHLRAFLVKHPEVEVIATAKGCALVQSFLKAGAAVKMRAVKDGDTLNLDGVTLEFYEVPNVHWPETMCTFERGSGTLFSCDAFGGYGATGDKIFDDEVDAAAGAKLAAESERYYATIVAPFSASVKKAVDKLTAAALPIRTVAPSHGLVWRAKPQEIISRYVRFAGYNTGGECEKEVCVVCASMYGNTAAGAKAVVRGIEGSGVKATLVSIPQEDASYALAAALRARAVVIAAPTCDYGLFPPVAHLLDFFRRKKIVGKKALRIGSYGWSGGAQREYDAAVLSLKWDSLPPYEWQGVPSDDDIKALEKCGADLAREVVS